MTSEIVFCFAGHLLDGALSSTCSIRPNSARSGRLCPDAGQPWPDFGQIWATSTGFGPTSANFGPNATDFGPISAKFDPPTLARIRPNWASFGRPAQFRRIFCATLTLRILPKLARTAPIPGGVRAISTEVGPVPAEFGPASARFGQLRLKSARIGPVFDAPNREYLIVFRAPRCHSRLLHTAALSTELYRRLWYKAALYRLALFCKVEC